MAGNPRAGLSAHFEHVKGNGWQLQASKLTAMQPVKHWNYTQTKHPPERASHCLLAVWRGGQRGGMEQHALQPIYRTSPNQSSRKS